MKISVFILILFLVIDPSFVTVSQAFTLKNHDLSNNFQNLNLETKDNKNQDFSFILKTISNIINQKLLQTHNTTLFGTDKIISMKEVKMFSQLLFQTNVTNIKQSISNNLSEFKEIGIRKFINWILHVLPSEVCDHFIEEWENATKGTIFNDFLVISSKNTTTINEFTTSEFVWKLFDEIEFLINNKKIFEELPEMFSGKCFSSNQNNTKIISSLDIPLTQCVTSVGKAKSVIEINQAFSNFAETIKMKKIQMEKIFEESMSENSSTIFGKLAISFSRLPNLCQLITSPTFAELIKKNNFIYRLFSDLYEVPESNELESNWFSFLEFPRGMVFIPKIVLVVSLFCVAVTFAFSGTSFHPAKNGGYEFISSTNTKAGVVKIILLSVAYGGAISFLLIELLHEVAGTVEKSAQHNQIARAIYELSKAANLKRVQQLNENKQIHDHEEEEEEENLPEGVDAEQDKFERRSWKLLFQKKINKDGTVPIRFILEYLSESGLADGEIDHLMKPIYATHPRYVSFEDFQKYILHPNQKETVMSYIVKNSISVKAFAALMFGSLLILSIDGGFVPLTIVTSFLFIFCVTVLLLFAFHSKLEKMKLTRVETYTWDLIFLRAMTKLVVGMMVLSIFTTLNMHFNRYCEKPHASCPNMAHASPDFIDSILHKHCDIPEKWKFKCGATKGELGCSVAGNTVWDIPVSSLPLDETVKKYLVSLSPDLSIDMTDEAIIDYLEMKGQPTVTQVCSVETPRKGDACQIVAASGTLSTIEDIGVNTLSDRTASNIPVTKYLPKEIFFVPASVGTCTGYSGDTEIVQPRSPEKNEIQSSYSSTSTITTTTETENIVFSVVTPDNVGTDYYYLCERPQNSVTSFTLQKKCVYIFSPQSVCSAADCSQSDWSSTTDGSVINSLYFTAVTQLTVGFGDIVPTSYRNKMRIFFEVMIVAMIAVF